MLSLSQFRKHLFPLFKVQYATGFIIHVAYDGVVYQVEVKKTELSQRLTRPRKAKTAIDVRNIQVEDCADCGAMRFSGVCMNSKCPSVLNPSAGTPIAPK